MTDLNTRVKTMKTQTPRFILKADDNEELFGKLFECISNKAFIVAAEEHKTIVIWPTWKMRKGEVIMYPCGNGGKGVTVNFSDAVTLLEGLKGTKEKGREVISNLWMKPRVEPIPDFVFGTNILDL